MRRPSELLPPPGLVALFGSGETSASGRKVYDWLLNKELQPVRVAILETPAGFQPNSAAVAGHVGQFLLEHLRNYHLDISIVPARKRGTPFSPDDNKTVAPVLTANIIFMGAGSPTYAVHQLRDSLAWYTLLASHRLGATLVLASAATIAAGARALPVYEIYKAGEELHWKRGLDLFGPFGLSLAFVSHWNNKEGGAELDTSRCYMGQARFNRLLSMLPTSINVVGIDEHTALTIDLPNSICRVMGRGTVTLIKLGKEQRFASGEAFAITELGNFHTMNPRRGIPPDVWDSVLAARTKPAEPPAPQIPSEVVALLERREKARKHGDWKAADELRKQILDFGWQVQDRQDGPQLIPRGDQYIVAPQFDSRPFPTSVTK